MGDRQRQTVWLLPHTHWDREWYEPFQRFRLRLVDLMDDVVDRAMRDQSFRFTMDGQMAAVDDYLEVRPERTDDVRALAERGQLAIGPWRVLMDEFLCSGETMLRNLELGMADAARLGPVMAIGYLPDMFGHCAQMPQMLHHMGIDQAVVWRGVPAAIEHHEFWWTSPDGTGVRTEYLINSYGNAADLFAEPSQTRARLESRLAHQSSAYAGRDFLAMYGTDHAAPLPTLMAQVADLNAGDGPDVRVATLTEYLGQPRTPPAQLPGIEGELRSHARANILPGVLSVRWHLKEAMATTERLLARYAEPFAALYLPTQPRHYLDLAWRGLVDSSCHDSVTGCGVDGTAVQVQARIEQAAHAAHAVRDQALARVTQQAPQGSVVVVNPLPVAREDLIEVTVPVPTEWPSIVLRGPEGQQVPTQLVDRPDQVLAREQVAAADLARLMHRVHDRELFGLQVASIDIDQAAYRLTFRLADRGDNAFDAVAAEERLAAAAASSPTPQQVWQVVTLDEPRRRLAAHVPAPALGWSAWRPAPAPAPSPAPAVNHGDRTLDNGLVRVDVASDGTLTIAAEGARLVGVGRVVDGGDCGDSYNYGPPAADRLVDQPVSVRVHAEGSPGPLLGVLVVERNYDLPASSDATGRDTETVRTPIAMRVEVRAGEPFVRLRVEWENRSRDHRLRLHVPTARAATGSAAQGQLAVVERGLTAEAGPVGEFALPTFPAERFVDAGGAGVVLGRTMEYEVLDAAHRAGSSAPPDAPAGSEVALTLSRSIGWLSRNVHPHRSEPAGPQFSTPDAQVVRPGHASLVVVPHAGDWRQAQLASIAERVLHPVHVIGGTAHGDVEPAQVEGLTVAGAGVDLLSLRRRDDEPDQLQLRIVNSSPEHTVARIGSPRRPVAAATRCDGLARELEMLPVTDGVARVSLGPWQIATVVLTG